MKQWELETPWNYLKVCASGECKETMSQSRWADKQVF